MASKRIKKLRVSIDLFKIRPIDSEGRIEVPCTVESGSNQRKYLLESKGIVLPKGQRLPEAFGDLPLADGRRVVIPSLKALFYDLESQLASLWAAAGMGTGQGNIKRWYRTEEERKAEYQDWQRGADHLREQHPNFTKRFVIQQTAKAFKKPFSTVRDHLEIKKEK